MRYNDMKILESESATKFMQSIEDITNRCPMPDYKNIARALTNKHRSQHRNIFDLFWNFILCESEDYKAYRYDARNETIVKRCNTIVETILRTDEEERANSNDHTCTTYYLRDLREQEEKL